MELTRFIPPLAPRHAVPVVVDLTVEDLLADLEAGRGRSSTQPAPLEPARPAAGGPAHRRAILAARLLGALPGPAGPRALDRLWYTPWTLGRPRPRPPGARLFTIGAGGARMHGWSVGEGPTVLLVHGWGGRSTDLAVLAGRLAARGRRAVAVDLPAHGASPGQQGDVVSLATALATVAATVGPLSGLAAHSIGGMVTMLALSEGLFVPRVVLAAPPASVDAMAEHLADQVGLPSRAVARLRAGLDDRFGPDVWRRFDVATLAGGAVADVLVVHDIDDALVPVREGRQVAAAYGREPIVTRGLGHGRVLVDPLALDPIVDHLLGPGRPDRPLRLAA